MVAVANVRSVAILFEPHGDINFSVEGRLLLVEVRGPWNAELIDAYARRSVGAIEAFPDGGPWAVMVVTRGSAMFTDDGERRLRELMAELGKLPHRVGTCFVIGPEVEGYHLCDPILREIYAPIAAFEIFETVAQARAWAERLIAAAVDGAS